MIDKEFWYELNGIRGDTRRNCRDLWEVLDERNLLATPDHDNAIRMDTVDRIIDLLEHGVTIQVLYARLGEPIEHTPKNLMRGVIDWLRQIRREKPK